MRIIPGAWLLLSLRLPSHMKVWPDAEWTRAGHAYKDRADVYELRCVPEAEQETNGDYVNIPGAFPFQRQ